MRYILTVLCAGLLLALPAVAAAGPSATGYGANQVVQTEATWWWKPKPHHPKPTHPVPELSVGGAGAALMVLLGGAMMMAERRRRGRSK